MSLMATVDRLKAAVATGSASSAAQFAKLAYELFPAAAPGEQTIVRTRLLHRCRELRDRRRDCPPGQLAGFVASAAWVCETLLLRAGNEPKQAFLDWYELYDALRWDSSQAAVHSIEEVLRAAVAAADAFRASTGDQLDDAPKYRGFLRCRIAAIYQAAHQNGGLDAESKETALKKALSIWDAHVAECGGSLPDDHLDFNAPRIAYCLRFQNRLDEALVWYERIWHPGPSKRIRKATAWEARLRSGQCHSMLGVAAWTVGDEAQAEQEWSLAHRCYLAAHELDEPGTDPIDSRNPAFLWFLSEFFWFSRQWRRAEECVRRLLDRTPLLELKAGRIAAARILLGQILVRLDRPEEAVTVLEDGLAAAPAEMRARFFASLIEVNRAREEPEATQKVYDAWRAETSVPTLEIPRFPAATVLDDPAAKRALAQECEGLLRDYQPLRVVRLLDDLFKEASLWRNAHVPKDRVFLSQLARAHFALGNSPLALSLLLKARDVHPVARNQAMVGRWIGEVFAASGQLPAAIAAYEAAIRADSHPSTLLARAFCLQAVGELDAAIRDVETALAAPTDERPIQTLTAAARLYLSRHEAHAIPDDLARALVLARDAIRIESVQTGHLSGETLKRLMPVIRSSNADELLAEVLDHLQTQDGIRALGLLAVAGEPYPDVAFDHALTSLVRAVDSQDDWSVWLRLLARMLVRDYYTSAERFEARSGRLVATLDPFERRDRDLIIRELVLSIRDRLRVSASFAGTRVWSSRRTHNG